MTTAVTQSNRTRRLAEIITIDLPTVEICDVGAMIEGTERYATLVDHDRANVTGFEPQKIEIERLERANRPRRKYMPYFIGKGGPATFYKTVYPGCCSLREPDPRMIDCFMGMGASAAGENFFLMRSYKVETVRLDDLHELPAPDYLKIDVQGGELDVLEGAERIISNALVIEVETEFVPLYKDQPLFGDVHRFLSGRGFLLHKFLDLAGRAFRPFQLGDSAHAPLSQLLWADSIFVRNFSQLELYSDQQLLKAAMILHDVYGSYDLVYHLLLEYDRRMSGTQSKMYFEFVTKTPGLVFTPITLKMTE